MRTPTTIKQIMPIEDGYTVLSRVEDEIGNFHMANLALDGWHFMYALIEGGEYQSDVPVLYQIDTEGHGGIDDGTSRIVPNRECPVCGYAMTPVWDDEDTVPLQYRCPKCVALKRKANGSAGGMDVHQSI